MGCTVPPPPVPWPCPRPAFDQASCFARLVRPPAPHRATGRGPVGRVGASPTGCVRGTIDNRPAGGGLLPFLFGYLLGSSD